MAQIDQHEGGSASPSYTPSNLYAIIEKSFRAITERAIDLLHLSPWAASQK
jgi:hypothetical protein